MQTGNLPPLGSKSRPYRLHLPADWYRSNGDDSGLSFRPEDIERAKYRNNRLGLKRYQPDSDGSDDLEIPAGSYVECYIIRKGIHDRSYYQMKNIGKRRKLPHFELPAVHSRFSLPFDVGSTDQLHLFERFASEHVV